MEEGLHYKEIYVNARNKVVEFGKSQMKFGFMKPKEIVKELEA